MMGSDCERIIAMINQIKDTTMQQISALAKVSDYRIIIREHNNTGTTGNGGAGDDSHNHTIPMEETLEKEKGISPISFTGPISIISTSFGSNDGVAMNNIKDKMYTSTSTFNNSYGSPWSEVELLQSKITEMHAYAGSIGSGDWIGQKHSLLAMMQIVLSQAVDAKWAITYYQDYLQRGYDHVSNDNQPSTLWDDFSKPTKKTDGTRMRKADGKPAQKLPSGNPY